MKVLILVLSARREPWNSLMDVSQETWDSENHPQAQTQYYCGQSSNPSTEKVFYSPALTESLEHVTSRTLEAFEKALTILDWDFIARTHSSTYVHKRNLVDFIETLPTKNVLCGLLTTGEKPFLWGGGSYIISRDVIEKFVANKVRWNLNIMEDNAMTDLANELEIPLSGNGRMASINQVAIKEGSAWLVMCYGIGENFTFTDWADMQKAHPHHYFRVKQDLERHKDVEIMHQLHRYLT